MTYTISKTDGTFLVSIPDTTIDTSSTSLSLIGKNAQNFGQYVDQNFVNLLQNFANSAAPSKPLQGQMWFDTSAISLNIFDGLLWRNIVPFFDGTTGLVNTTISLQGDTAQITIVENSIISVTTGVTILTANLLDFIVINDIQYQFAVQFPKGLFPGINLAVSPANYQFMGTADSANKLTNPILFTLEGSALGNVIFDGSSNVTLNVSLPNVYISNSNVSIGNALVFGSNANVSTIAGIYTSVTVNDTGLIIGGGNLQNSDVINALGYTPFSGDNVNAYSQGNTIVIRDTFGNFNTNVMVGTATYAQSLASNVVITINGDVNGSVSFDGSSNAIIQSNLLVLSNLTPGIYNSVTIDNTGRVTNGTLIDVPPIGSMILYTQLGFVPSGWAVCNGQTVSTPQGTFTTPNLSNVTVGGAYYIMKVFNYLDLPSNSVSTGEIYINLTPGVVPTIEFSGGPTIFYPPLQYNNAFNSIVTGSQVTQPYVLPPVVLNNPTFYEAMALLLSSGDANAVYMSQVDIYGDLSNLTIYEILYNLQARQQSGLPSRLGKYALSYTDIYNYSSALEIPIDLTYFTIAVQDALALIKVSDISNSLNSLGIFPSDGNIFGCMFLGIASYIAILTGDPTKLVGLTLIANNQAPTGTPSNDNLTNLQFITQITQSISNAINAAGINNSTNRAIMLVNQASGGNVSYIPSILSQPSYSTGNIISNSSIGTCDGFAVNFGGSNIDITPGVGGGAYSISSASSNFYYSVNSIRYLGGSPLGYNYGLSNHSGTGSANTGYGLGAGTGALINAPQQILTKNSDGTVSVSSGYITSLSTSANIGNISTSISGLGQDNSNITTLTSYAGAISGCINALNGSIGYTSTEGGFQNVVLNSGSPALTQNFLSITWAQIAGIAESGNVPAGIYGMGFTTGHTSVAFNAVAANVVKSTDQFGNAVSQMTVQAWQNGQIATAYSSAGIPSDMITTGTVAMGWMGLSDAIAILQASIKGQGTVTLNRIISNITINKNPSWGFITVDQWIAKYNNNYGTNKYSFTGINSAYLNNLIVITPNTNIPITMISELASYILYQQNDLYNSEIAKLTSLSSQTVNTVNVSSKVTTVDAPVSSINQNSPVVKLQQTLDDLTNQLEVATNTLTQVANQPNAVVETTQLISSLQQQISQTFSSYSTALPSLTQNISSASADMATASTTLNNAISAANTNPTDQTLQANLASVQENYNQLLVLYNNALLAASSSDLFLNSGINSAGVLQSGVVTPYGISAGILASALSPNISSSGISSIASLLSINNSSLTATLPTGGLSIGGVPIGGSAGLTIGANGALSLNLKSLSVGGISLNSIGSLLNSIGSSFGSSASNSASSVANGAASVAGSDSSNAATPTPTAGTAPTSAGSDAAAVTADGVAGANAGSSTTGGSTTSTDGTAGANAAGSTAAGGNQSGSNAAGGDYNTLLGGGSYYNELDYYTEAPDGTTDV